MAVILHSAYSQPTKMIAQCAALRQLLSALLYDAKCGTELIKDGAI
jgi:hypothetical protein